MLIPIAGSHYIAAEPLEARNPIFSINGLDMIVMGSDLPDYLAGGPRSPTRSAARHIRFWSDVVYESWDGWAEMLRDELERTR